MLCHSNETSKSAAEEKQTLETEGEIARSHAFTAPPL
jgi:hypothetical protein